MEKLRGSGISYAQLRGSKPSDHDCRSTSHVPLGLGNRLSRAKGPGPRKRDVSFGAFSVGDKSICNVHNPGWQYPLER